MVHVPPGQSIGAGEIGIVVPKPPVPAVGQQVSQTMQRPQDDGRRPGGGVPIHRGVSAEEGGGGWERDHRRSASSAR